MARGGRTRYRALAATLAAVGVALVAAMSVQAGDRDSVATEGARAAVAAAAEPTGSTEPVEPTATATATPTPLPTATPEPPESWAELEAALAAGDSGPVMAFYDLHRDEIEQRGRDSFPGLAEAMQAEYGPRLRAVDVDIVAGRFDEAIAGLDALLGWYPDRAQLVDRRAAAGVWAGQLDDAVEWTESVPHLFIHSLIIDTDKVFDGDYTDAGYREYMITRVEFERALHQLHERDYVLVDVHDLYRETVDGLEATPLLVPAGKRPLVFSIDDVSYYNYMATDGFPDRLEVDDEFNVATVLVDDDGTERLTLDGDAMPILDRFVLDHPDFSVGGAKGIIALTGYEGVFGYDISVDQLDHPDYPARRAGAIAVAERLGELGWDFASHSYSHDDALRSPFVSYGRFVYDSDRWDLDIKPVLGKVDLYITPFGFDLGETNPRLRYLVDELGFNAFMPISVDTPLSLDDGYLRMYRTALDGFMLGSAPHLLEPFLDAETVWDSARD